MKPEKSKSTKKFFKVIVLGETGVGKTSLLNRYLQGTFSSQTTTTVGVVRVPIIVHVNKDDNDSSDNSANDGLLHLQVLDAAGCYAFRSLIQSYIRDIDAVVFAYDITDKESFACLPLWNDVINKACEGNLLVKMLVGNKKDLESEREVQTKNAKNYAEFEGMFFMEVSVKEPTGQDVFQWLAWQLQEATAKELIIKKQNTGKPVTRSLLPQGSVNTIIGKRESIRKKFISFFAFGKKAEDNIQTESQMPTCQMKHKNHRPYVLNDYVASWINY